MRSNLHKRGALRVDGVAPVAGHVLLDLGDDVFTRGRPHPMIEPGLRNERLAVEMADAAAGVLLFDCVIGYGSHPDPAGVLAAGVEQARRRAPGRELVAIASVTGTRRGPAGLRRAGAPARGCRGHRRDRQPARRAVRRGGAGEGGAMNVEKVLALFGAELSVVNVGLASFAADLRSAGGSAVDVDWRPPAGGDPALLAALDACLGADGAVRADIAAATRQSVERLLAARPTIVGIGTALDVVPGMRKDLVLHAGPPVEWERMSGPTRGAVMGGLVYEGLARTPEEAARLAASGKVAFAPCHHHAAVGPMAGVVTASMPVWILENTAFGNRAYSTLNEGLGKVLRYGAYDDEVLTRLRWMEQVLAPALREALAAHGPLDLRNVIAQALQMGDEVHNRNRAATSLLIRTLAPHLVGIRAATDDIAAVLRFLDGNDHFFLNLSMAASKCSLDPAAGIPRSTR